MRILRYCEKCGQMTNHRKIILPLLVHFECLKCKGEMREYIKLSILRGKNESFDVKRWMELDEKYRRRKDGRSKSQSE